MLHERLLELERLCHQEKALLAGKCSSHHTKSSSPEANLPPAFAEAHNRMLAWLHSQRRLLPQPKYITCLSNKSVPYGGNNEISTSSNSSVSVPSPNNTQSNNEQFLQQSTSSFVHNNLCSKHRNDRNVQQFNHSTHSLNCQHRGIRTSHSGHNILHGDQGSMSSDDNRSPLTPGCMKRSLTSEDQSLNRSRQHLLPNDNSVPNTPSLSPNIRSPSILKRVDSSPRIAPTTSMDSMSEILTNQQQQPVNQSQSNLPKRSIIKRRTLSYDKEKYPEVEQLRSSPDGCSRGHSFSAKMNDNRSIDHGNDFSVTNRKSSNLGFACSNCQFSTNNPNPFTAQYHPDRYENDLGITTPKSPNNILSDDFSPMLKSCEELLTEQRIHHRSMSEDANKTLEAVENDLRELCNLPRTKYSSTNSDQESGFIQRNELSKSASSDIPKSRITRQHGSFKRNGEKTSRHNFDRTRSAVDLTTKDQDNVTFSYDQEKIMSSTQLSHQGGKTRFSSHNMEAIGRSISSKSLHTEQASDNVESFKNSPVFNYCTSSLPKKRTIRTFKNSFENSSPKENIHNRPAENLTSTLKATVGQVINYGLEDLVKQHDMNSHLRRQSNINKVACNFSSLPYSGGLKSSQSNPASTRSSLRRDHSIRSDKDFQLQEASCHSNTEQLTGYPCSHSPPVTPCSHSLEYYQERLPEAYNPDSRISAQNRSMPFRYSNHRNPTGQCQQSCGRGGCIPGAHCRSHGQFYYNDYAEKCNPSSRSLATTPLEDQKDIHIPNYFCNNSKGSAIPTSLMPRHQHSHTGYGNFQTAGLDENHSNLRDPSSYDNHSDKAMRFHSASAHGCTQNHHLRQNLQGNPYKSCQYPDSENVVVPQQTKHSSTAETCCNSSDVNRPYSFPSYRSDCPNTAQYSTSLDCHENPSTPRSAQYYQIDQGGESNNTATTWSWEQRIADVEKSHVNNSVWNNSRTTDQHLTTSRYNIQSEVHAQGCEHFHGTNEARNRDIGSSEHQIKLAPRRRSFSKELAEFAFGGQPRRSISCIPTNLVRNALSSHDPSYKLLKQDAEDDQSEAGASSIDMTPYRYA